MGLVDMFWTLLDWVLLTCSGLRRERKFMLRRSRHYADIGAILARWPLLYITSLISALTDSSKSSSNRKPLPLSLRSLSLSLSLSPVSHSPVSNLLVSKRLPLPQYAHNNRPRSGDSRCRGTCGSVSVVTYWSGKHCQLVADRVK